MRIAPAGRDDLANLVAFRDETARWLAARGIDQWSEPCRASTSWSSGHHHAQPLGQARAVDPSRARRAGAVRPQGDGRPRLRRRAPRRRAARLGRHPRRQPGCPLAPRGRVDDQRQAAAVLPRPGLRPRPHRRTAAQPLRRGIPAPARRAHAEAGWGVGGATLQARKHQVAPRSFTGGDPDLRWARANAPNAHPAGQSPAPGRSTAGGTGSRGRRAGSPTACPAAALG
jgi:hypothetical protein